MRYLKNAATFASFVSHMLTSSLINSLLLLKLDTLF